MQAPPKFVNGLEGALANCQAPSDSASAKGELEGRMMEEEGFAAPPDGLPERPPSVSEILWNAIPDALREEFLKIAANGLRRGVHPDESIAAALEARGLDRPVRQAPASLRRLASRPMPVRSAPQPPAPPQRSGPVLPYGSAPVPAGQEPVSVIGHAIHKEMRLSGRPGRAAAEAEATVLAAIAADPVMAYSCPEGVRTMGARVTEAVANGIKAFVRQEAEKVIDDIRARRAAGDAVALRWTDPDEWDGDGPRP